MKCACTPIPHKQNTLLKLVELYVNIARFGRLSNCQ